MGGFPGKRRSAAKSGSEAAHRQSGTSEASGSEARAARDASAEGFTSSYEGLVKAIIRPPRMQYDPAKDLGPREFEHCGRRFRREDLQLQNKRGLTLQCSWWKFHAEDAPAQELPCVIYLHGNAASRLGAVELLQHLLRSAVSVFAADFAGSGQSEGEYVSLGYYEREDVEAVIAHLRASGEVSTVGLWGHSMGATTALLYGDRDPTIAALVLDCPFADLTQLANELVNDARERGLRVPGFAITMGTSMIRRSVRRRAKFDPKDVSPIANCGKCFIPALFAHGSRDAFIKPHHSEQLHEAYAGDKNLIIFDGEHCSERPDFFFDSAVIFLRQTLAVKEEHCLDVNIRGIDHITGLFSGVTDALRNTETEMMRQAMMVSVQEAAQAPVAAVPREELRQAVQGFEAVTGAGGDTAAYYAHVALSQGETVDFAIQLYFENGCSPPPAGWQPPSA
uniref:Serine aminopeptidase S33 domain-containing protein n=1 Tax=Alexandrium monilatum TaxID=311494 RepID=A0A7S4Q9J4_9DINO|mmetsp:Transcript_60489/g.187702  ORF Transcript_60489/g.187702 Transcript_60489/m.187702 type:complete len:451 (-) Transcript_60489:109-1461(-)